MRVDRVTSQDVAQLLEELCVAFPSGQRGNLAKLADLWAEELSDQPVTAVRTAVRRHIRHGRFFPKLAEIRSEAVEIAAREGTGARRPATSYLWDLSDWPYGATADGAAAPCPTCCGGPAMVARRLGRLVATPTHRPSCPEIGGPGVGEAHPARVALREAREAARKAARAGASA